MPYNIKGDLNVEKRLTTGRAITIPQWQASTDYKAGDVLRHPTTGELYRVVNDHTSPASFTVDANIAAVAGGAGGTIEEWQANTPYSQDDLVIAPTGAIVRANSNFTSGAAFDGTEGPKWTFIGTGRITVGASNTYYYAGQIVLSVISGSGNQYAICLVDHQLGISSSFSSWVNFQFFSQPTNELWQPNTVYLTGFCVVHEGALLECTTAHISGTSIDSTISNWKVLSGLITRRINSNGTSLLGTREIFIATDLVRTLPNTPPSSSIVNNTPVIEYCVPHYTTGCMVLKPADNKSIFGAGNGIDLLPGNKYTFYFSGNSWYYSAMATDAAAWFRNKGTSAIPTNGRYNPGSQITAGNVVPDGSGGMTVLMDGYYRVKANITFTLGAGAIASMKLRNATNSAESSTFYGTTLSTGQTVLQGETILFCDVNDTLEVFITLMGGSASVDSSSYSTVSVERLTTV